MFDFLKVVDCYGIWCMQWDYVVDCFGIVDLLLFMILDMDFVIVFCIIEVLNQCLMYGVFGYSCWKNDEFFVVIVYWFFIQYYIVIDFQLVVYGFFVIYMVLELICQWFEIGEGVVIYMFVYDVFYKVIEGNQCIVMFVVLEKQVDGWFCDMGKLEVVLVKLECKIMFLCSLQNFIGKVWMCDELEIMVDLCECYGVWVIFDEIYMDMVWGEQLYIFWSNVVWGDWVLLMLGLKSFNIFVLIGVYGIIENSSSCDVYLLVLKGCDGFFFFLVLVLIVYIVVYQKGVLWLDVLCVYLKDNLMYIVDKMNVVFFEFNWQIL